MKVLIGLKKACHSGIQCDILLVSGHFGEAFFGSSGYLLLETLENFSCRSSCSGILTHPKEVFLLGSHTIADKNSNLITPREYINTLFFNKSWRKAYHRHNEKDKNMRERAEMIAAFRYSPLGFQTQDRMKKVFPNARTYGFRSIAPKNAIVSSKLHQYFKSIPKEKHQNYSKPFLTVIKSTFWANTMEDLDIQSIDGSLNFKNLTCILKSDKPDYKKLSWINDILRNDENMILTYLPSIHKYLSLLGKKYGENIRKWPEKEVFHFKEFISNKSVKDAVSKFLSKPIRGILSAQLKVLRLGKKIGWYDQKQEEDIQENLLRYTFSNNLELDEMKLICILDTQIELSLDDLPKEKWNLWTIEAIGCVKPQSEKIHFALITPYRSLHEMEAAIIALGKIKPQNEKIQLKLVSLLLDKGARLRLSIMNTLIKIKPQSEKIYLALTNMLTDGNEDRQWAASYILSKLNFKIKKAKRK